MKNQVFIVMNFEKVLFNSTFPQWEKRVQTIRILETASTEKAHKTCSFIPDTEKNQQPEILSRHPAKI